MGGSGVGVKNAINAYSFKFCSVGDFGLEVDRQGTFSNIIFALYIDEVRRIKLTVPGV